MKNKTIILFILLLTLQSCKLRLYPDYTLKQQESRELIFHFSGNNSGSFEVKYLCANTAIKIEQKFTYKKISKDKILIKGIENRKETFIYIPSEYMNKCNNSDKDLYLNRIPVIDTEEILIYNHSLFWQKIQNKKIISAFTLTAK